MVNNSLQVTTQNGVGNPGPSVAWLDKLVNGISDNINKQCKPVQIRYHSKSPHIIIKINDIMNM